MDYRRLEAFRKVYELKSFSKAGSELFLSQPTISAHVSSLEKDLGAQLFDRMGRVVMPTPAGDILYKYALRAFSSLDSARAEIQLLNDKIAGDIVIGGSTIPAHYMLPSILSGFMRQYPDVRFHLKVGDSQAIIKQVRNGGVAVGVVGASEETDELEFTPVLEDELVIIGPPEEASRGVELDAEDLARRAWVMREQGSGTLKALERGLEALDLDIRNLRRSIVVESTQAVLQCVKAGMGLSITSRLAAGAALARGELAELSAPRLSLRRAFYRVYNPKRHAFPALHYFIEHLANNNS